MTDDRLLMARQDRTPAGQPGASSNSPSFARLPTLVAPPTQTVEESLQRLADLFSGGSSSGTVGFRIRSGSTTNHWSLHVRPGGSKVSKGPAQQPNLELLLSAETWLEIAAGGVSPLDMLTQGRLRVRGDLRLARDLLRAVATSPDAIVDPC
jgi:putative sterol carrier protein